MLNFKIDNLSVWEKLQKTEEPIIMYGTGNGADKVLDVLDSLGVKLSGITASNGFVRERRFREFPVKPLEYFEEKYGDFTVIITFGTSIPQVMDNIFNISLLEGFLFTFFSVFTDCDTVSSSKSISLFCLFIILYSTFFE